MPVSDGAICHSKVADDSVYKDIIDSVNKFMTEDKRSAIVLALDRNVMDTMIMFNGDERDIVMLFHRFVNTPLGDCLFKAVADYRGYKILMQTT